MNDQKQAPPLKVVVRIDSQGDDFTVFSLIVGGAFISPANDSFVCNRDVAQFLYRLQPDLIQWQDRVTSQARSQIESDLAALRESRPDVPKVNGELVNELETAFMHIGIMMRKFEEPQTIRMTGEMAQKSIQTALAAAKKGE